MGLFAMFNNEDAKKRILVRITRSDGEHLTGYLMLPMASDLTRTLNNDVKFLELEDFTGNVRLIAKSSVIELSTEDLKQAALNTPDAGQAFDPYRVLGLTQDATLAEVRKAYLGLTKKYHPDQYSQVVLPEDVAEYMSAVFSQANTAYNLIKASGPQREAA